MRLTSRFAKLISTIALMTLAASWLPEPDLVLKVFGEYHAESP